MKPVEIRALNMLRRRKHWLEWGQEIKLDFWSTLWTKRFWKLIDRRFKESDDFTTFISVGELRDYVDTHNFKSKNEYHLCLDRLKKQKYRRNDRAVQEFLQVKGFELALKHGIEILGEAEGLGKISAVRDRIDSLVRISQRATNHAISFFDTTEQRREAIRKQIIASGFCRSLDRAMSGGIARGELGLYLGATNRGKTAILCNHAAGALLQGYNVIYFTLDDISGQGIARRVDQILLGWSEKKIVRLPNKYQRKLRELRENAGELLILDHNDRDTSVLDIRGCVENAIEDGAKPDLILIDYADVMTSYDDTRDDQKVFRQICRGLRKLGVELDMAVWTASQGNRISMDADEVKLSQIAGAIAKVKSADCVIGMNQTEQEHGQNIMRLAILKTRMGAKISEMFVTTDWSTMRIRGLHDSDEGDD